MIEICSKYSRDLGNIPRSLLLIDKYKYLFEKVDQLKKLNNDRSK